jgi:hypothetical protein
MATTAPRILEVRGDFKEILVRVRVRLCTVFGHLAGAAS